MWRIRSRRRKGRRGIRRRGGKGKGGDDEEQQDKVEKVKKEKEADHLRRVMNMRMEVSIRRKRKEGSREKKGK